MLVSYDDEKNRRQVPKVKEYLSLKKYCDVLYCYLQVISNFDEENKERYILKKNVNFTKIGADLDISRQTASTKFKYLKEMGLIIEQQEKYILANLDKEVAELVPFSTLRILTNTVKDNVISTYIYLLVRYRAEKEKPFIFTYEQIKKYVGIGVSRGTDYIVSDILLLLSKLDLLKYSMSVEMVNGGARSIYRVDSMNNKIEDPKDVEIKFG